MSDQKLGSEDAISTYDTLLAGECLGRYAAMRPFVQDKRVLDIACGQGYGSRLLRDWGAGEVVGVDLSEASIATAQRMFERDGVRFVVGNACRALEVFGPERFDVIVSFRTIEDMSAPDMFLGSIKTMMAPGGAVFIGFPNSNNADLKKHDFERFRSLSEQVLGLSPQWLSEVIVPGFNLVPGTDQLVIPGRTNGSDPLKPEEPSDSYPIPGQQNQHPKPGNASYYLGVWGIAAPFTAVAVSGQFHSAVPAPWKALVWSECRRTAQADLERLTVERDALTIERSVTRRRLLELDRRITKQNNDLEERQFQAKELQSQVRELRSQVASAAGCRREGECELMRHQLQSILSSTNWRLMAPFRMVMDRIPKRARFAIRWTARIAYWVVTPNLWLKRYRYFKERNLSESLTQNRYD